MAAPPKDKGRAVVARTDQKLKELKAEYVPIDSIKPNTYNANRQDPNEFELLCRSIREDGFTQPVIVDRDSREIVDGEHRWRAAQALGFAEIPVAFVNWSLEKRQIATLRHNRARGSEDVDLAVNVLRDLQELGSIGWAQDSLLIDDDMLADLLTDKTAAERFAGEDFSEAWVPSNDATSMPSEQQYGAVVQNNSMTSGARASAAEAEQRLEQASSEEERTEIRRQTKIYPINLIFRHEEAEIVRAALGDNPSERLLELCREVEAQAEGS